jgi:hypothetical protein
MKELLSFLQTDKQIHMETMFDIPLFHNSLLSQAHLMTKRLGLGFCQESLLFRNNIHD